MRKDTLLQKRDEPTEEKQESTAVMWCQELNNTVTEEVEEKPKESLLLRLAKKLLIQLIRLLIVCALLSLARLI